MKYNAINLRMVLDGAREQNNQHRDILSNELETMGIRLNRKAPDIYFKKKATGGVKFNATCSLTNLGDNPIGIVINLFSYYKKYFHNIKRYCNSNLGRISNT